MNASNKPPAIRTRRECLSLGAGMLLAGMPHGMGWPLQRGEAASAPWASEPNETKSVAAVITVYFPNSHADVILTKILEGWKHDGGPGPALKLASIYIDQPEGSDFGLEILKKHRIPRFDSIEEAVTVGGSSIPVDGVISIGEHGNYPVNQLGQQLYPRKRFFEGITNSFEKHSRVVPVFNDKHISTVWSEAAWMVDRAREMKVPFMAGSSLPVSYRSPELEIPWGSQLEAAVGIGYSGLDIYGFHTLECYQTLVERRSDSERGVKWVRCLEGSELWSAVDDGWVDREALQAVLNVVPRSIPDIRDDPGVVLFQFEYVDGFRGAVFMVPNAQRIAVGIKVRGQAAKGTTFEERSEPRYPHFAFLLRAIERMVHTGVSPYPVERTLLTGGILDRALTSKSKVGTLLDTPELRIAYTPVDYPYAPNVPTD